MRLSPFIVLFLALIVPAAVFPQGEWERIEALYAKGKIYAGLRMADKELAAKDPDLSLLVLRAEGHNRIGQFAKAEADARKALQYVEGEKAKKAALQLGIAMMESARPDSARAWLERSLGSEPDHEARIRLGKLDLVKGDARSAMVHFDHVLAKDPDHVRALLERGAAHAIAGDTAAARRDMDRAVELAPRDPVAWNSRGFYVHAAEGRHAEAIKDYDRAIKFDPNYSFAFNNRGWSLFQLGETDKALKNINLADRKRPGNPFVHRNLGLIAMAQGDTAQACLQFDQALRHDFTALHGDEVQTLMRLHCHDRKPAGEGAANDRNARDTPAKPPIRSNAPIKSNAP